MRTKTYFTLSICALGMPLVFVEHLIHTPREAFYLTTAFWNQLLFFAELTKSQPVDRTPSA